MSKTALRNNDRLHILRSIFKVFRSMPGLLLVVFDRLQVPGIEPETFNVLG